MKLKKLLPVVGIAIFIYILFNLNFDKIFLIFSGINPLFSFISFFAIVPLILLSNIEWQIVLKKQNINAGFFYSLKNIFIGYFYGFITPGGLGAYTRSYYLHEKSRAPLAKCLSNIIIFNTIDYLALLLLGLIGAFFLISLFPYLFFIVLIVIIIVIFLVLLFFKFDFSRSFFKKIIRSRIFSTLKNKLESSIDSFYEDIPSFSDLLIPYGLSVFGWVVKYVELFLIAKLFLIEIPIIDFILILAVADVVSSLPISYYGLGVREWSLIGLFSIYPGITNEMVVSLSFFIYVILWLVPSIFGAVITFFEAKKDKTFSLDKKNTLRFEGYMKKNLKWYRDLAKIVKKNISRSNQSPVIVDLGVGPGLLSNQLNKYVPKAKIIGIDPSDKMLEIAKRNANLEILKGRSDDIPLDDKSVDLLVSRFSLTYWDNPIKSFKEIHRVLKPNGRVILECLNKDFSRLKLFLIKIGMIFKNSGFNIARYHVDAYRTAYSKTDVEHLFLKSGFEILDKKGSKSDWKFIFISRKKGEK